MPAPHHLPQPTPCPPNPPRQLHILLHNRHPLRMDGAQIRVFEQMHHERLRGFLERLYGLRLPAQGELAVDREEGEADFADLWGFG